MAFPISKGRMPYMRQLIILLCLSLFLSQSNAQSEETPIIALHEGAIYAVKPSDGSAEILVPASSAYGEVYEPASFFSAEWLSPDGQYLAYRMTYPVNPAEPVSETSNRTHRLFILDLQTGTFPHPISLGAFPSYDIDSVAWSPDGNFLYVLIAISGEEEILQLVIIEREQWQNQIVIPVEPSDDAPKRSIFAIEDTFVLQERGWMAGANIMTAFDNEGEVVKRFELSNDYGYWLDFFISTPFTPLFVDGQSEYSLIDYSSNEILYQIELLTGEVSEFPDGYVPAMVSRTNPETSLRVSLEYENESPNQLYIRDTEANYLGSSNPLRYQAFGPEGDSMGSTFALSPDGQSLAWLEDNELILWQDGGTRGLGFSADVIAWASPLYIPVYDPEYFGG
jgi:hypothetical protein